MNVTYPNGKAGARKLPVVLLVLTGWLAMFGGPGQRAFATISESITSFAITNYVSGYVIDADAFNNNPGYNRDAIRVRAFVQYSSQFSESADYRIEFRLLDADNNPVTIRNQNGFAGTVYYIYDNVSVTSFISKTLTYNAPIAPLEQLDSGSTYTAEVRLFTTQGTIGSFYQFTGDVSTDGPRTYYHFRNTLNGDAAKNVNARMGAVIWSQKYLVDTDPDKDELLVSVGYLLRRYDDFFAARTSENILVHLDAELVETNSNTSIPLENSRTSVVESMFNYTDGSPRIPYSRAVGRSLSLRPAPGQQLDPVSGRYEVRVSISYEDPAFVDPLEFNTWSSPVERVLHFNGNLSFGGVPTTFASIANNPTPELFTKGYVQTTLEVDANSGSVVGDSQHYYGDGSPLTVRLTANGNATLAFGTAALNSAVTPDTNVVAGVLFERTSPMTLNNSGLFADLKVRLPVGSGWRESPFEKWMRDELTVLNQELDPSFRPTSNPVISGPFQFHEETKPVWIDVSQVEWRVNQGEFVLTQSGGTEYVREAEHAELDTVRPLLINPTAADKKSNELYYRSLGNTVSATGTIAADANNSARLTTDWDLGPGQFVAHFPYGVQLAWSGAGLMEISADSVVPSTSKLTGADVVNVYYPRDCPDNGCGPGVAEDLFKLIPDGAEYFFTPDGGLAASGSLTGPRDIEWGYVDAFADFAHQTFQFPEASFLMSGTFLRGDQTSLGHKDKPGVLLLSGVATDLSFGERPGTNPYLNGFADYAGMNFRVGADSAFDAHSYLGGQATGNYPLTGRSKYYVRGGGVSGIHEAVFGGFPATTTIYGYPANFSNFGLSFLDNENVDSRTEGYLSVPFPSGFDQEFEQLSFLCNGALDSAEVPSGVGAKVLSYWLADFQPLAIDFRRNPADSCDPGIGFLVLGSEAYASHVEQPLFGSLGFESNGNLITPASGLEGVDSRLKLPNNVKLDGPADEAYTLNPVADAYYNHHNVPNQPATGFINIAGALDVPFFENIQVHLQTSAQQGNDIAPIYLMGGWPSNGWETTPGQNYFSASPFDPGHLGFPTSGPVEHYRKVSGPDNETYRPRAMRNWLKVVNFDYPLSWSSSSRSFKSWQPTMNDFLVIRVEHQIDYLSAENAEVSFGAHYDGLPQINLANIAFNAIDDATGVVTAFADAGLEPVRRTIEVGVDRLDDMLSDQVDSLIDPILDQVVDPLVDNLYAQLESAYDSAPDVAAFKTEAILRLDGVIDGTGPYTGATSVKAAMNNIIGASKSVDGVLKELDDALARAENAILAVVDQVSIDPDTGDPIAAVQGILAKNLDDRYPVANQLVLGLIGELASEYLGPLNEGVVDDTLEKIRPTIEEITVRLADIAKVIADIRSQLNSQVRGELQGRVSSLAAEVQQVSDLIRADVNNFLNTIDYSLASPFDEYSAEEIKQEIRQSIEDRFYGSEVVATVQTGIKEWVYDVDAALREHLDSAMASVNQAIRDLISQSLAEVDKSINSALGDIGSKMGAGQIDGYAHINGDSLRELRLDGRFQWQVPDEMEFNAYLRIRELDSDGTDGCSFGGEPATEVTLGATDVGIDWISPDLHASASTKFTFDNSGYLRGMAGALEITGGLKFETFEISYLGAAVAFGLDENYLSAACGLRFNKYEGFGGIYFGRTCTLDPIAMWAPDVASVLGNPPFTGAYVYGEAWVPLNEAIGIPSTCLFNISAGVGAGVFYFLEGPTWGGNMLLGVSGEALCVVSIKGEIKLIGVKNGSNLRLKGSGRLEGKAGACPFCIKFGKTVGLTYDSGSWDVDL